MYGEPWKYNGTISLRSTLGGSQKLSNIVHYARNMYIYKQLTMAPYCNHYSIKIYVVGHMGKRIRLPFMVISVPILKSILCSFLQESVNFKATQLLIG